MVQPAPTVNFAPTVAYDEFKAPIAPLEQCIVQQRLVGTAAGRFYSDYAKSIGCLCAKLSTTLRSDCLSESAMSDLFKKSLHTNAKQKHTLADMGAQAHKGFTEDAPKFSVPRTGRCQELYFCATLSEKSAVNLHFEDMGLRDDNRMRNGTRTKAFLSETVNKREKKNTFLF